LNGLYDAKLDGAPVLAISGLQYHDLIATNTQQDVELEKLFVDVWVYKARIMGPAHVENIMKLACRAAVHRRGVVHVTVPVNMQSLPVKSDARSGRNLRGQGSSVAADDVRIGATRRSGGQGAARQDGDPPPQARVCRGFSRAAGGGFWPETAARGGWWSSAAGELFSRGGLEGRRRGVGRRRQ
jgi:Thiamine pyrophosphate enzyme, N-terminal TPP binding domain